MGILLFSILLLGARALPDRDDDWSREDSRFGVFGRPFSGWRQSDDSGEWNERFGYDDNSNEIRNPWSFSRPNNNFAPYAYRGRQPFPKFSEAESLLLLILDPISSYTIFRF